MDNLARAAFIIAQAACATAEVAAMQAENAAAEKSGETPPWTGDAFRDVPNNHQISWNAAISYLRG